jgi:glutamate carboxypeptidase
MDGTTTSGSGRSPDADERDPVGGGASGETGASGALDRVPVSDQELAGLRTAIHADLPAFLRDLERLVGIDCGSYTPEGVDEVGRFVAAFLERMGFVIETHRDPEGRLGDTLVGTVDGDPAGPRLLLIAHLDTVFDPGTAARRPFRIDGGIARGPGVTDMKSGLLAGLYAVRALRTTLGSGEGGGARLPFARLTFIANPDEEIGSPASTPVIRRSAEDVDVALVLECARANGDIVSSRKGNLGLRIEVEGRAAHAGVEPEKGRSATLAAAHLTVKLHALNGRWPGVTVNVGVLTGGTRPNVVAESAALEVDIRAVTRASMEAIEAEIAALVAAPAVPDVTMRTIETGRHWPMEKLERSGRLVDLAVGLARDLGFEVRDAATGGASDANTTAGMGIPTLDGLGPIGGMDHSPEEWLDVESIVPRTTLLAGLMLAIAHDPVVGGWRG